MKIQPSIFIFLLVFTSISLYSNKSSACNQDNASVNDSTGVKRIEIENSMLFIYNSDTIFVSKAVKDLSIIFQIAQLHYLFFKDRECHSITIQSLSEESKKSNKKNKYFKAEGFIPNLLNQYEWLIKIENANATRKTTLEDFINNAGVVLLEIKIQI